MSSEETPQPENIETLTPRINRSKRPRQELLNQQNLAPNEPVIELELDTDTNSQQKTNKNSRKHNKISVKVDLNKIPDQLILISNAKPPGYGVISINMNQLNNTKEL